MKYYFDGVIVVEGKNDVSFLSSFIDSLFVVTNGYDIPIDEIDFLRNLYNKKIIVLTDSDDAGKTIRERLKQKLDSSINVEVDITKCNKNNKHGVAECDKQEVVNQLSKFFTTKTAKSSISLNDINCLGITNKEKRDYLSKELHLGKCNSKKLLERLSFKDINIKDIKTVMEGYHGN